MSANKQAADRTVPRAGIEIGSLIDGTSLGSFHVGLVILAFFIMLFDGFDVSTMALATPSIMREWQVTSKATFGPVLSASLFGMLFGSPLFGFLGDVIGRKKAIIAACLFIGCSTLATAGANSLWHLMALRFLTGLGMGGLAPNTISLIAEYAPKRVRAKMVIVMYTGITFGGAVAGAVSALLLARFGWPSLFVIGGAGPLVMSLLALAILPESLKFLVLKGKANGQIRSLAARISREELAPGTSFYLEEDTLGRVRSQTVIAPSFLFSGRLAVITPLLWICMASGLMGYYFLMSWMPTLLASGSGTAEHGALATAIFQVGGTLGGLLLSHQIDRRGVGVVAAMFGFAVPIVGVIGYLASDPVILFCVVCLAGFCVLGMQFGINAVASIVYPTPVRASAVGWAFAVARIGAILGPVVGGWIIEMNPGPHRIFFFAASPFLIGLVACTLLGHYYGKSGTDGDERPHDRWSPRPQAIPADTSIQAG